MEEKRRINIENNLTREQQDEFNLRAALVLIESIYEDGLIDDNTYNNICKKYKSHLK